MLDYVRQLYQRPATEPLLALTVLVHEAASAIRLQRRWKRQQKQDRGVRDALDDGGSDVVPASTSSSPAPSNTGSGSSNVLPLPLRLHRYAGYALTAILPIRTIAQILFRVDSTD